MTAYQLRQLLDNFIDGGHGDTLVFVDPDYKGHSIRSCHYKKAENPGLRGKLILSDRPE